MMSRRVFQILLCLSLTISSVAYAQEGQSKDGSVKYSIQIDMGRAYVGGICIIKSDESLLTASVVNEFGVSIVTCRYDLTKDKVKIVNSIKQLRGPFVKKVLKNDFKILLNNHLAQNDTVTLPIKYYNQKNNITYNLIPL